MLGCGAVRLARYNSIYFNEHSSMAARLSAGSTLALVEAVCQRRITNGFAIVRPPGHHAGPVGVVTCKRDPHGSHGFCLLNNIAIAGAYAVNRYRHDGAP